MPTQQGDASHLSEHSYCKQSIDSPLKYYYQYYCNSVVKLGLIGAVPNQILQEGIAINIRSKIIAYFLKTGIHRILKVERWEQRRE